MGLAIFLNLFQVEDVIFDDVNALNSDLMASSIGELYNDVTIGQKAYHSNQTFQGPILYVGPRTVQIADVGDGNDFEDYGSSTQVWGCYGNDVWQVFADHMTEGKLVIHLDIEGNPDEYYVITPGSVTNPTVKF